MENDFSSIDIGEDFMAHYGVKGMRWGVRNDPVPTANTYKDVIDAVKDKPNQKKLITRLTDATAYASQNPEAYIALRQKQDITVLTGKQFIDAVLANNGLIFASNISPINIPNQLR